MGKIIKNNLGNFLVVILIFLVMVVWIFSGWPRIWQKPSIPPGTQEARAGSQEFTTTDNWVAVATSVDVECWGGGGGGGDGATKNAGGGGGGGGGGYAKKLSIPVTPSNSYTVTVGAGGGSAAAGGNSSFTGDSSTTITANGGGAGANDGGSGGNGYGGSCTGGCSTGPYTGGSGANGTPGDNGPGGGGGGSAGTGGNGNHATSQTGASPVEGGGPGGDGGAENNAGSAPASGYGGGGGGAGNRSGGPIYGGSGYGGKCILTWVTPPTGSIDAIVKTDGTGKVDITIEVDDADDNDCKAKIEYEAGSGCAFSTPLDPTLDEAGGATADFNDSGGPPSVVNTDTYQVGTTANYRIITSSGSNTVMFDWLSATDLPSGDGLYCVRLTVNDDTQDQTTPATDLVVIDNVAPTAPGNLTDGGKTGNSITLTFGSQTTETNFWNYKIFYKQGTSGVTESDTQHADSDLNDINYNGTANTTVSGLNADTDYVFNIWAYDAYGHKANAVEVSIKTAAGNATPTVSNVKLNNDGAITLIEDTTQSVIASATIEDTDGCDTISGAIAKVYQDSQTASCSANDNSCYLNIDCTLEPSCTGNTNDVTCAFNMWFFAVPTDATSSATSDKWTAYVEATDSQDAWNDNINTVETDVNLLTALDVSSSLAYGELFPGGETPTSEEMGVKNTGNRGIDVKISLDIAPCTNFPTCTSVIASQQQQFFPSSFTMGEGTSISQNGTTPVELNLELPKPTSATGGANDDQIFWGIAIPIEQALGTYNGTNVITAVSD